MPSVLATFLLSFLAIWYGEHWLDAFASACAWHNFRIRQEKMYFNETHQNWSKSQFVCQNSYFPQQFRKPYPPIRYFFLENLKFVPRVHPSLYRTHLIQKAPNAFVKLQVALAETCTANIMFCLMDIGLCMILWRHRRCMCRLLRVTRSERGWRQSLKCKSV